MIHKLRLPVALACAIVMIFMSAAQAVSPTDYDVNKPEALEAGHLYSAYGIVIDAESGTPLFEKDARTRCYPASTTKILTCILAIEHGPVGDMVTIPDGITVPQDSSMLGIKPGEIMPFNDLLYGMMLESGNDAALAVAILVSGSENAFVKLMNNKAEELGLTGTNFVNPHGYHRVNHYTTAYDMALIARYAMQNDMFRQIASTYTYTLEPTNMRTTGLVATSEYLLLDTSSDYYYAPCTGIKSGNTNAAGRCFVGAATQNGVTLISVAFKAPKYESGNRYRNVFVDTIRLMKYGFLQYTGLTFNEMYALSERKLPTVSVGNADEDDPFGGLLELDAVNISDAEYREWYLTSDVGTQAFNEKLSESFASRLTFTYTPDPPVAPIKQGNVVGALRFEGIDGAVLEGTLVASRDMGEEPPTLSELIDTWADNNAPWIKYLMPRHTPVMRYVYWALLVIIIALIVIRVRRVREFNRRRRALLERKKRAYLAKQKQLEAQRAAAGLPPRVNRPNTRVPARKPAPRK